MNVFAQLDFYWIMFLIYLVDFVDSSGMRFYYDTPRQYDAGVLMAGCMIKSSIVIPPKQREWITDCYCPSQCTRKVGKLHHYLASLLHATPHLSLP